MCDIVQNLICKEKLTWRKKIKVNIANLQKIWKGLKQLGLPGKKTTSDIFLKGK